MNNQPQSQNGEYSSPYNRPFIINGDNQTNNIQPAVSIDDAASRTAIVGAPQQPSLQPPFAVDFAEIERKQRLRRLGNTVGGAYLLFEGLTYVLSFLVSGVILLLKAFDFSLAQKFSSFISSRDGMLVLNAYIYLAILGFLIIPIMLKKAPSRLVNFGKFNPKKGLFAVMASLGCCVIGNYVSSYVGAIFEQIGITPKGGNVELGSSPASLFIGIIAIGVFPAMLEELASRGFVMGALKERFNPIPVIILSSMFFGLWHGNLVQIPFAFCVGISLGFAYYYTGSIWPSIIAHFLNNTISVLLNYFTSGLSTTAISLINLCTFAILIVIGIIGFFGIVRKDKKAFCFEKTVTDGTRRRTARDVKYFLTSPCVIIFFVITLVKIIVVQVS